MTYWTVRNALGRGKLGWGTSGMGGGCLSARRAVWTLERAMLKQRPGGQKGRVVRQTAQPR